MSFFERVLLEEYAYLKWDYLYQFKFMVDVKVFFPQTHRQTNLVPHNSTLGHKHDSDVFQLLDYYIFLNYILKYILCNPFIECIETEFSDFFGIFLK